MQQETDSKLQRDRLAANNSPFSDAHWIPDVRPTTMGAAAPNAQHSGFNSLPQMIPFSVPSPLSSPASCYVTPPPGYCVPSTEAMRVQMELGGAVAPPHYENNMYMAYTAAPSMENNGWWGQVHDGGRGRGPPPGMMMVMMPRSSTVLAGTPGAQPGAAAAVVPGVVATGEVEKIEPVPAMDDDGEIRPVKRSYIPELGRRKGLVCSLCLIVVFTVVAVSVVVAKFTRNTNKDSEDSDSRNSRRSVMVMSANNMPRQADDLGDFVQQLPIQISNHVVIRNIYIHIYHFYHYTYCHRQYDFFHNRFYPYNHSNPSSSCPTDEGREYMTADKTFNIECGIDYSGIDGASDIAGVFIDDFQLCIELCAANNECVGAGYGFYNDSWTCWLKSRLGTSRSSMDDWPFALLAN